MQLHDCVHAHGYHHPKGVTGAPPNGNRGDCVHARNREIERFWVNGCGRINREIERCGGMGVDESRETFQNKAFLACGRILGPPDHVWTVRD